MDVTFSGLLRKKSHALSNRLTSSQDVPIEHKRLPFQKHRFLFQVEQITIRKKAQKATQRCAGRQNLYGCFKPSIYRVDDNMFVRVRSGHHRVSQNIL